MQHVVALTPTNTPGQGMQSPPTELVAALDNMKVAAAETASTDSLSISTITQEDDLLLPFLQALRIPSETAKQYRRTLTSQGYDDIQALDEADEGELLDLGLKVGHVKRIKRATPTSGSQLLLPPQPPSSTSNANASNSNRYFFGDSFLQDTSFASSCAAATNQPQCMTPTNASLSRRHGHPHPPPPGTPPPQMDSSLQLSVSVQSVAMANEKIMQQAERIRQLESELSSVLDPADKKQSAPTPTSTTNNSPSPSPESRRVLSAEERLQAHKERKQKENRYKELAGKWEAPTPKKKKKVDLTKKVARNDEMVERLAANAQDRRRHSEIQQNVENVLHRYATADDYEEHGDGDAAEDLDDSRIRSFGRPHSRDRQSALMQRLGMTPNTRRNLHSQQEATSAEKRTLRGHRMAKPQWKMSNEFLPASAANGDEEEDSIDLGYISDVSPERCHTCNALDNLEEDLDDPGLFYCSRCWDEYESSETFTAMPQDFAEPRDPRPRPAQQKRAPPQSALDNDKDDYHGSGGYQEPQQQQDLLDPPQPPQPPKDRALWIVHDNPQLGGQVLVSGSKRMKCMVETKEPNKKNCVRILTGVIDYSGSVSKCDFDRSELPGTETGTECLRLRNVRGYIVDHSGVESRLSNDKSIHEFHLDANEATVLTGRDATMTTKEFLEGCEGSVDVIIDPQCSPGEWYPQREASADSVRKLAPQFRSKGVGYIRLGDDMSRNGQAFLSSDGCKTFFSSSSADNGGGGGSNGNSGSAGAVTAPSYDLFDSQIQDNDANLNLSMASTKAKRTATGGNNAANTTTGRARSRQLQGLTIDFSDDEDEGEGSTEGSEDDNSDDDESASSFVGSDCTPVDDAGDILKQLQSVEITKDMKWSEKADLITRLGKVLAEEDSPRGQCSAALKVIQDVLGGKNVNVHVLRAAVEAAGNIGERLGNDLVSEVSWRPIMLNMLRLLSSKQGSAVAKQNLKRLHGGGYNLSNSLVCISHALGLGKEAGGRRAKAAASRAANALKTANNVDVVEWLADRVEAERHMKDLVPTAEKSALETLSRFFLSHVGHRDPRCRKNLIEGLISVVLYGVRLGQKVPEALSMVSELKMNNPRGWKQISQKVQEGKKDKKRPSPKQGRK